MNLDQWTSLSPSALKQELLADWYGVSPVELYNALIVQIHKDPLRITLMAEAAVEAFEGVGQTDEMLLFLELQARSNLAADNMDQAFAIIARIIETDSPASEMIAVDVAKDIARSVGELTSSVDRIPKILTRVAAVFERYDIKEEVAKVYLSAAYVYSRHGASQAAYRCAAEAEQIAHSLRSLSLLARCLHTAVVIACEEAEPDFHYAIGVGEYALTAHEQAELDVPAALLANLGVAHMNLDAPEPATDYFERALACTDLTASFKSVLQVNLATCLRRRSLLDQAATTLAKADAAALEDEPEFALELSLSAAKLAVANADFSKLIQHLLAAAKQLDRLLASVLRLHHRRGIRERYIRRIEGLVRSLPADGWASDILLPLLGARGNAMADWLEILSWAEKLTKKSILTTGQTGKLDRILRRIRNLGAPHLLGFREKYDDAWTASNFASVWDELSEFCTSIAALDRSLPLDEATSQRQAELCQLRLSQGHCLMATTYAGDHALLWYFIAERYERVEIPLEPMMDWHTAQLEYAQGTKSRKAFTVAMDELTSALSPVLDPVFARIAASGCASVRYIDDTLRQLPFMLFALRNADLLGRMAEGLFEVRLVPALTESLDDESPLTSLTSIVDQREDLLLAAYEGKTLARAAGLPPPAKIEADSGDDLALLMDQHDALIVSTHGTSLSFFSDAYFAKLGGLEHSHLMSVAELQEAAPDFSIRLAVLNTCYSGSSSNRNYQKRFRTSDGVAIPNLFLLNRRAVAFAGAWKISDTASFVLAHLVGEALQEGLGPSSAVARAIAKLPSVKRSEVVRILSENLPEEALAKGIARLGQAPEDGMFSHPYFTAGLAIHGLL